MHFALSDLARTLHRVSGHPSSVPPVETAHVESVCRVVSSSPGDVPIDALLLAVEASTNLLVKAPHLVEAVGYWVNAFENLSALVGRSGSDPVIDETLEEEFFRDVPLLRVVRSSARPGVERAAILNAICRGAVDGIASGICLGVLDDYAPGGDRCCALGALTSLMSFSSRLGVARFCDLVSLGQPENLASMVSTCQTDWRSRSPHTYDRIVRDLGIPARRFKVIDPGAVETVARAEIIADMVLNSEQVDDEDFTALEHLYDPIESLPAQLTISDFNSYPVHRTRTPRSFPEAESLVRRTLADAYLVGDESFQVLEKRGNRIAILPSGVDILLVQAPQYRDPIPETKLESTNETFRWRAFSTAFPLLNWMLHPSRLVSAGEPATFDSSAGQRWVTDARNHWMSTERLRIVSRGTQSVARVAVGSVAALAAQRVVLRDLSPDTANIVGAVLGPVVTAIIQALLSRRRE